jgi:dihydrofolate synthase / folylpolyglutamate synthase
MQQFNNLQEVMTALQTQFPSSVLVKTGFTLDKMYELLELIGSPQNQLKVVHVAGTSGKTSTCYYTAGLLKAAGKKVGLTVSPHIDTINDL